MKLELDAPNVGKVEKKYLSEAIDSGFISTFGPAVPLFEKKFAEYVGIKKAVSTQSGTAALHMALYELGIGKGDEVIVPALTFVATANPVLYVGAVPVFADVEPRTWNIDPSEIKKLITKRTKAILPVHLYGNPAGMDEIMRIARSRGIFVIEDAAAALGARFKGRFAGTFGDLGCFSFNGNKTITTGGGGMVVGNDTLRMDHIKFLINQARDEARGYFHPEIGFNYRMTNIEAALGLAQMKRFGELLEKKKALHTVYREELSGVGGVTFQELQRGAESALWFTCVCFGKGVDVASLQKRLKEKNIPTRRIFMPLVEFPPYRKAKRGELDNSYRIYKNGLCLPSSTLNSEEDVRKAARILRKALGHG